MRRVPRSLAWLLAGLGALAAAGGCGRGAKVPREGDARRVVTLTPSATEIVAALGALDLIVGVDRFSAHPPEVRSLPKTGDFLSPDLEAILALHPDIAIADAVQTQVRETLNQAGIRVISPPMQTTADVRAALLELGTALGRQERARAEVARLDAELAAVARNGDRAARAAGGRRPRALFVVDRQIGGLGGMVAAGPGTYIDELLRLAGAVNVLQDSPVRYAKISPEEILSRDPDVILDAVHTSDARLALADWRALPSVAAVRTGRVHVLGDTSFVSPGPRLGATLRRLFALLWNEGAADVAAPPASP